ncbi:ABC transporter ATP-binding protein [Thermasporomyces composti]|jgi:peptide/nickel transport system ATP-binding protein|uniref:Peptide/nickel transport system ATP-binding protein n=1 Tax=Thermasporomyces composti TaxID=696763 RepID=A0A3D9VDT3_THECX|nr:ABC transporter ATP-binding protein [Thermasporomyces composti]REF37255.1 peptide/nickel transport system ATP-binding protein [Thermasporomyces composti]
MTSTSTAPRTDRAAGTGEPVLSVRDLRVEYHTDAGAVRAVNGVSFDLMPGEKLGLVGESGSGKSTIALALMRMIKEPGRIAGGQILLHGRDILRLPEKEMRQVRAAEISMIPQGAMNSLNPVARIEDQIVDTLEDHSPKRVAKKELLEKAHAALESVGLRREVGRMYPHQLSGGMKQRVCIAIAVAMEPKVLIADEPTSALDVVVQRQVMGTLLRLQEELGVAVVLIGHDMGLMAQSVDRLAVMYAGKLAEVSPIREIFDDPLHPYTDLLIDSLPKLERRGTFRGIPGLPPSLHSLPPGCLFHPRCPKAMDICAEQVPPYREHRPNRFVACHLHEEGHATA